MSLSELQPQKLDESHVLVSFLGNFGWLQKDTSHWRFLGQAVALRFERFFQAAFGRYFVLQDLQTSVSHFFARGKHSNRWLLGARIEISPNSPRALHLTL